MIYIILLCNLRKLVNSGQPGLVWIFELLQRKRITVTLGSGLDLMKNMTSCSGNNVSQLLSSGFIQDVYYQMNRRTFYQPEVSLRGWFTDLVKDKVRPQIKANGGKIQELKELYEESGEDSELITTRLESLRTWNNKLQRVLPMIVKVIGLTGKTPKRQSKTLPTRGKVLSREEVGK